MAPPPSARKPPSTRFSRDAARAAIVTIRQLVITADDFGADVAVNGAVEIAHREGVLTAASLMVGGPAAEDAVARAHAAPSLRVGLHLVLVEGRPTLPADRVPRLVDSRGLFPSEMVLSGMRMFFDPAARRELAAEIEAQFRAFAATGLRLDHVNAHKHFQLHPTIGGLILRIGARFGMTAARLPIEPFAPLSRIEPGATYGPAPVIDLWAGLARRRFQRAGVRTPDQVFGLRWSGAMTEARMTGLLDHLPPGLTEIYLHPATRDSFPGSAAGYAYQGELAALRSSGVRAAAMAPGVRLGGFADFSAPQAP